jgi:hypothetical protein
MSVKQVDTMIIVANAARYDTCLTLLKHMRRKKRGIRAAAIEAYRGPMFLRSPPLNTSMDRETYA